MYEAQLKVDMDATPTSFEAFWVGNFYNIFF